MDPYIVWTEEVWDIQAKQTSWIVQKILKSYKYFQETGYDEDAILAMNKYSIKKIYL